MSHVKVNKVFFAYNTDLVINDASLEIERGELVLITGENGSGKSTLLKLILGQLKANKGEIFLLDENIRNKTNFKKVGYVPQVQNFDKVTFPITCEELVCLNQYEDFGFFKVPRKKHLENAKEILTNMGLKNYIDKPFNELSGGLQQRVIISRAMINEPDILILDEPTAGVDKASKEEFLKIIKNINREKQVTIVIVTHELELIKSILDPDKIYKIEEGRISYA